MAKLEINKWSARVLDGQIAEQKKKIAAESDDAKKAELQAYLEKLEAEAAARKG